MYRPLCVRCGHREYEGGISYATEDGYLCGVHWDEKRKEEKELLKEIENEKLSKQEDLADTK